MDWGFESLSSHKVEILSFKIVARIEFLVKELDNLARISTLFALVAELVVCTCLLSSDYKGSSPFGSTFLSWIINDSKEILR